MNPLNSQKDLQSLIENQIEERIDLDYKRADSLGRTDGKKAEITKDISAMANAAGGIIIYGIAEYTEQERKHLPEKLDPIDRGQFSKEWLDQVAANIRPRIANLKITAISLASGHSDTAYVVEIPQSTTAHQALDNRYHRRFNFTTVQMLDHEIRDVMSRALHPSIDLTFIIRVKSRTISSGGMIPSLEKKRKVPFPVFEIVALNTGSRLAQYVTCWLKVPVATLEELPHNCAESVGVFEDKTPCAVLCLTNRTRDVVGWKGGFPYSSPQYSEPYFQPILPTLDFQLAELEIVPKQFRGFCDKPGFIEWEVQADNAPRKQGRTKISDIEEIWEYKRDPNQLLENAESD